ncbi:MAG: 5-(carboxyamino)imidazole ribonucleotide synthase [Actinomycetaceae bacterium]|nr:5-(carboxyamino)imidazole ribonucleotide synthase [Actinomycetaceae bacterium]
MSRTVAVVGGGQLARMMVPPASELAITLKTLVEAADTSAAQVTVQSPVGSPKNLDEMRNLIQGADVLTFEHEHIPQEILANLEGVSIQPPASALLYAQNKLKMREKMQQIGAPVPRWARAESAQDVARFGEEVGWPIIAKTPTGGYDGKGVRVVSSGDGVNDWLEAGPVLVEEKVPFTRELAVLLARRPSGEIKHWPVSQSIQAGGVCSEVIAPAPNLPDELARTAQEVGTLIATELGVTGVLAVEMFIVEGDEPRLSVNELAMRPHNTGHWTIDGANTSQFEQHLRAVLDLPLGDTTPVPGVWVMKNLLGSNYEDAAHALPQVLAEHPEVHVNLYGKSVRPGRKLGHVTVHSDSVEDARACAGAAVDILFGQPESKE